MTWGLVSSEISPLQSSWPNAWKRITGDFTTAYPVTPTELINTVKAAAIANNLTILDYDLYTETGNTAPTDKYHVVVTVGPNDGNLGPEQAAWLIKAAIPLIIGWTAKSTVNKVIGGSSSTNASLSSIMEPIMMIMMMSMLMPMMQNMTKSSD